MPFVKVKKDDKFLPQKFMVSQPIEEMLLAFSSEQVIKDNNPSTVVILDTSPDKPVLKLVKPRRVLEFIKLFYGRSRISKEIEGNKRLKEIGLQVPDILGIGYGVIPALGYQYLGFYLMENIETRGCHVARFALKNNELVGKAREDFFNAFCDDIKRMIEARIIFSDLKLNNVYVDQHNKPVWIDTGVTVYDRFSNRRFKTKMNYSINRFLRIYEDLLTRQEKQKVSAFLFD